MAASIGIATLALMRDMSSRSGSVSPCCASISSGVSPDSSERFWSVTALNVFPGAALEEPFRQGELTSDWTELLSEPVGRTSLNAALGAVEGLPPREGLQTVAALRVRVETLEASLVEKAIREGWSWRQIAEVLGVTKQAAHKKHARRVAERLADARTQERRKLVVTGRARLSVRLAREEAAGLDAAELRPEHLLLGLLRDAESMAGRALAAGGATLTASREVVAGLAPAREASGPADERLPVSADARAVMEESLREAVRRGDEHLGVEHLLLSLLHDEEGQVARTLTGLGVDLGALEERLGGALAGAV